MSVMLMEFIGTFFLSLTASTASYTTHALTRDLYSSGAGIAVGCMFMAMVPTTHRLMCTHFMSAT
jgi:hypothetical protein